MGVQQLHDILEVSSDNDDRPHLQINIAGHSITALVDTGASITCISYPALNLLCPENIQWLQKEEISNLTTASGDKLRSKGKVLLSMRILGVNI